jgi:hypothetical protein
VAQVFVSPGQLFEALREKPVWVGALLVGVVMIAASTLLIPTDLMVEVTRQQLISQGNEVPPGLENMGMIFKVSGAVGAILFIFIWAFLLAGLCALFFNFIMGGEGKYKQYLSVVAHGTIIGALGALATLPLKIAQGDPQLTLSLGTFAFFLEEGYVLNVLKVLDLFGIWGSTVMGIGVTKMVPKISLGAALTFFYGLTVAMALVFGWIAGLGG